MEYKSIFKSITILAALRSPLFSDASSLQSSADSPRKSWFNNIFTFKPASFSLLSVCDARATRNECMRLLEALSVTIELTHTDLGAGVLRCWLDDAHGTSTYAGWVASDEVITQVKDSTGAMSVTKGVRFRVEFRATTYPLHLSSGYLTSLILTQERGALSTFKLVYNILRRDWDLDTPRTPGGTSIKIVPSPILVGEHFSPQL